MRTLNLCPSQVQVHTTSGREEHHDRHSMKGEKRRANRTQPHSANTQHMHFMLYLRTPSDHLRQRINVWRGHCTFGMLVCYDLKSRLTPLGISCCPSSSLQPRAFELTMAFRTTCFSGISNNKRNVRRLGSVVTICKAEESMKNAT